VTSILRRSAGPAALVAGAFLLRTALPWRGVFGGGITRFAEHDPWYHVRLIEYLIAQFPLPVKLDPYLAHPAGQLVTMAPGLDLLVAGLALLLGGGEPSPRLVEGVAALVPPVMGALLVLPTYLLARVLSGRRAAWLAAALVAVLPGQALQRSLLGFTDHHAAEALFSAAVLACLAAALRCVGAPGEAGGAPRNSRALALAAGACLALYRLFWANALLGALLLGAAFLVAVVWARPRGGAPPPGLCRAFALTFGCGAGTSYALACDQNTASPYGEANRDLRGRRSS